MARFSQDLRKLERSVQKLTSSRPTNRTGAGFLASFVAGALSVFGTSNVRLNVRFWL